ncbi:tRNA modification GTPase MnmE [Spirochaetia bacterium]|nr:tRNA modification GTPase MnmE [Spirochaetia bacterium]
MDKAVYGNSDPVAAFATPLGESALAIIRTSGTMAVDLTATVFSQPEKLLNTAGNTVVHGWILGPPANAAPRSKIDEVLISVYRGPHSYTGEDGADISCHGGIAAAKAVMGALKAAGFRDALPGEFTFRAFMNGKLDLTRAESVMEIVSAKTDLGREHAVGRLSGVLEQEIQAVKELLVQVLAETELYLDYSEEEAAPPHDRVCTAHAVNDEEKGRLPGRALAEAALTRLRVLSVSYRRERLYQDGALVVIAGRPNAGKSSLFNLLVKEERSIVTDIPGTTRDWIESWIVIEGIPIRLADTAGLRGVPEQTNTVDLVEQIGIRRSRELLAQADLVLYMIDGSAGITVEDQTFFRDYPETAATGKREGPAIITVWNKVDIAADLLSADRRSADRRSTDRRSAASCGEHLTGISCKTNTGIPALTAAIASALSDRWSAENGQYEHSRNTAGRSGAAPGTARQKELIDAAASAVQEALALAEKGEPLDLIAPLLREGVNSLGEITGEVSTADILDAMFSTFCVGK